MPKTKEEIDIKSSSPLRDLFFPDALHLFESTTMKHLLFLLLIQLSLSLASFADTPVPNDTQLISDAIVGYVDDFNQANAAGVASRWTAGGRMTDAEGNITEGRSKLLEQMTAYFNEVKNAKLTVDVASIEMISPSVARETGTATLVAGDAEPELTDYVAVHVKTDDGWKLDSIIESEATTPLPSHFGNLKPLQWMVGTWSAGKAEASITVTCRWSTNQNFLIRSFAVNGDDSGFEGTQIIGWDPINQAIRSWTFDSDGGYAAGRWTLVDDAWTEQSKSILPDGRTGSATHLYQQVDGDGLRYRSIARQVDDELLPSIDAITFTKQIN